MPYLQWDCPTEWAVPTIITVFTLPKPRPTPPIGFGVLGNKTPRLIKRRDIQLNKCAPAQNRDILQLQGYTILYVAIIRAKCLIRPRFSIDYRRTPSASYNNLWLFRNLRRVFICFCSYHHNYTLPALILLLDN